MLQNRKNMNNSTGHDAARHKLHNKKILLLPYTHTDWAWCFRRKWHEARYTLIFDETVDLAEQHPEFCFFMDSLSESLEDYFRLRPDALARWRTLVEQGRFTLAGGQYANLRPSTAPEETYIRNIETGHRLLNRWFPGFRPLGYSNLDTAIGHSQLPQVLSMAGFKYYLAGRPELLLEMEGKPKYFRWQGPGNSEILTCVQHYGILYSLLRDMAEASGKELGTVRNRFLDMIDRNADSPADAVHVIISMDDGRPLRDHITDEPFDLFKAISEWNRDEESAMEVSTTDRLYKQAEAAMDRIPAVKGTVDQADVGYNGPFCSAGLRHLRDRAAALLVEAEMQASFAAESGFQWPEHELNEAWRLLLRAQSHGVQFLFSRDIDAMRLDLLNACAMAEQIRNRAMELTVPSSLPQDTDTVAVVSGTPVREKRIVSIPVQRVDFETAGFEAVTPDGKRPVQQPAEVCNPRRPGEWSLLVETEVPACGPAAIRLTPVSGQTLPEEKKVASGSVSECGPWKLEWEKGRIQALSHPGGRITGSDYASILEPLLFAAEHTGWRTTHIDTEPVRVGFADVVQTEFGPLRYRFERRGTVHGHDIFQDIQVYADSRCYADTQINCGPDTCYFGLAMGCSREAELHASIPFGIEERDPENITYSRKAHGARSIERQIPGMFYARDWVRAQSPEQTFALIVQNGDRYWYRPPDREGLVHLLIRVTKPFRRGWERYSQMDRPGFAEFRHTLAAGSTADSFSRLSRIADEARFPLRYRYTPHDVSGLSAQEHLCVEPENMRLLCCRNADSELEIRLVESAGKSAECTVTLGRMPCSARLTDLCGNTVEKGRLRVSGSRIMFTAEAFQICNLRIAVS